MADEDVLSIEQAEERSENSAEYMAHADAATEDSDSDEYDPSASLQAHFGDTLGVDQIEEKEQYDPVAIAQPFSSNLARNPSLPSSGPTDQPNTSLHPSQASSRSESRASQSAPASASHIQTKTKTIGGFVVDEEDEDEDEKGEAEYEPPGVDDIGLGSTGMIERPISENANESVPISGVSVHTQVPVTASLQKFPNNSHSRPSSVPPNGGSIPSQILYNLHTPQAGDFNDSSAPTPTSASNTGPAASKSRLPHDLVGLLEDRIRDDPRGDVSAWLELIGEHRSRNRIDGAREVFERFFKIFPAAADQWVAYVNMESENNELYRLEQIFNRTLLAIPSVQLWSVYLDYVRRRNPLTTDTTGQARRIISSAYELALQNIGMDKDSATVWTDYVQFIRSGPGSIGGSNWQDQQKMDLLRKAYQKAISVPTHAVNMLWKEYDQFEMGLNKLTGRKFLQERSPAYMTARSSYTELQNITRDLNRTTLPRLPPGPDYEGAVEFNQQVDTWKKWVTWEKADPLVLKEEDLPAFKARVLYVYKQALMALRFVPEIWFDAADFCFQNSMEAEGINLLKQSVEANPESCLLAFKLADRLEITSESEQDPKKRGSKVREPYDRLLDSLYELMVKARARESQDLARVEESFENYGVDGPSSLADEDEDDDGNEKSKEAAKKSQIEALRKSHGVQIGLLSKTISYTWIALMRAMRRIQGKGKPGEMVGSRQIFADARKRGRITSDVYIASALIEYHCYKDPAATKIFERGAKLFPEDENFALEYLKHLIDINDVTNARAVFEMTVRKLASNPDNILKAKPIFAFLHEYESRYGDLVQVVNLESRMRELFPDDPTLAQFAHRYGSSTFDPTAVQLLISPSQARSHLQAPEERAASLMGTPTSRYLDVPSTNSPKRPLELEDSDEDGYRPRKFVRAESPLKAAGSRRGDQQKRQQYLNGSQTTAQYRPHIPAAPLPSHIVQLLSIIPPASAYHSGRLSAEKIVDLMRRIDVPPSIAQLQPVSQSLQGLGLGHPSVAGAQPYAGRYPSG